VVYTWLDDFGAWVGGFVRRWTSEPAELELPPRPVPPVTTIDRPTHVAPGGAARPVHPAPREV
jgi:hypothetical protein